MKHLKEVSRIDHRYNQHRHPEKEAFGQRTIVPTSRHNIVHFQGGLFPRLTRKGISNAERQNYFDPKGGVSWVQSWPGALKGEGVHE